MPFKLKKMRMSFVIALALLISSLNYVQATNGSCEVIEVDKEQPLYQTAFTPYSVESLIRQEQRKGLSATKAKGKVGELLARNVFEKGAIQLHGKTLVSITTMFENQNCRIQETLRSHADQGIDDVFVILREDGWIDQRYNPIFHEAKYDGRCSLNLKDTVTLCRQLSLQWLDGNLTKVQTRSSKNAWICFNDHNEVVVQSCTQCVNEFKQNIEWLRAMLTAGNFHRTASLLCADGTLRIYNVNGA